MDFKDELTKAFASKAGASILIMLLRALAERTENTLDDALVDGIEGALNTYF